MGNAGGMFPYQQNPYGNRPYAGYSNYPMHYGRGSMPMHRPIYNNPMFYGGGAMQSPMYPSPMFGGMFRNGPTNSGGLQSSPPSGTNDGNIHLNRPHFDHQ